MSLGGSSTQSHRGPNDVEEEVVLLEMEEVKEGRSGTVSEPAFIPGWLPSGTPWQVTSEGHGQQQRRQSQRHGRLRNKELDHIVADYDLRHRRLAGNKGFITMDSGV